MILGYLIIHIVQELRQKTEYWLSVCLSSIYLSVCRKKKKTNFEPNSLFRPLFAPCGLVGPQLSFRASGHLLQKRTMDRLVVVVLPRSQELERLMEEHKLKKAVLMCAHHAASAPS